ncbi:MAG: hypothetical protein KDI79_26350, partial [Anaerolineae bacterium]|nr:hypothetical protein [Anaerolineae bacterium]
MSKGFIKISKHRLTNPLNYDKVKPLCIKNFIERRVSGDAISSQRRRPGLGRIRTDPRARCYRGYCYS